MCSEILLFKYWFFILLQSLRFLDKTQIVAHGDSYFSISSISSIHEPSLDILTQYGWKKVCNDVDPLVWSQATT